VRIFCQRLGGEIEQPGRDDAAAPPDLGDLGKIEVELVVLGVAQRCGLGVDVALHLPGVRLEQDVHAFRVRGHEAVLDAVVDHLHEVARAGRAAMQIALLGGSGVAPSAGSARRRLEPGCDAFENRIQVTDNLLISTDHQTVAALQPEHPAAGAAIDVMYAALLKRLRSQDVVAVVAVAPVDDGVAGSHARGELFDGPAGRACGDHHPDGARFGQLGDQPVDRVGTSNAAADDLSDGGRADVIDDAAMAVFGKAPDQARSHAPQTDHAELHLEISVADQAMGISGARRPLDQGPFCGFHHFCGTGLTATRMRLFNSPVYGYLGADFAALVRLAMDVDVKVARLVALVLRIGQFRAGRDRPDAVGGLGERNDDRAVLPRRGFVNVRADP
jgi:hypothetical protein